MTKESTIEGESAPYPRCCTSGKICYHPTHICSHSVIFKQSLLERDRANNNEISSTKGFTVTNRNSSYNWSAT